MICSRQRQKKRTAKRTTAKPPKTAIRSARRLLIAGLRSSDRRYIRRPRAGRFGRSRWWGEWAGHSPSELMSHARCARFATDDEPGLRPRIHRIALPPLRDIRLESGRPTLSTRSNSLKPPGSRISEARKLRAKAAAQLTRSSGSLEGASGYASVGMSRSGGNAIRFPRAVGALEIRPSRAARGASIPTEAYPLAPPLHPNHGRLPASPHARLLDQGRAQDAPDDQVHGPTEEEGV